MLFAREELEGGADFGFFVGGNVVFFGEFALALCFGFCVGGGGGFGLAFGGLISGKLLIAEFMAVKVLTMGSRTVTLR